MTTIDCVGNEKMQEELTVFLRNEGHSVIHENNLVVIDKKLSKSEIDSFLKQTDRSKHKTTFVDADSYVIAIPVAIKDIGLDSCEFCGYTGYTELIAIHRRSHQAL
jgi:hypothetical protein